MKKKREQLIAKGLLQEEDGYLLFTKDMEFGSPSNNGSVVRGVATNGLTSWKNSNGVQLKLLEAEET